MGDGGSLERQPARIVVAEDDREMRAVLVDFLSGEGHEVLAVEHGAALLVELARLGRFHYSAVDLVVTDLRMPLFTGLQALETIRSLGVTVPFLLLTAFGSGELSERVGALGAVLVDKPIALDRLRREIASILRAPRPVTPFATSRVE